MYRYQKTIAATVFAGLLATTGLLGLRVGEKSQQEICKDQFFRVFKVTPPESEAETKVVQSVVDEQLDNLIASMLSLSRQAVSDSLTQESLSSFQPRLQSVILRSQLSEAARQYQYALKLARCCNLETTSREP